MSSRWELHHCIKNLLHRCSNFKKQRRKWSHWDWRRDWHLQRRWTKSLRLSRLFKTLLIKRSLKPSRFKTRVTKIRAVSAQSSICRSTSSNRLARPTTPDPPTTKSTQTNPVTATTRLKSSKVETSQEKTLTGCQRGQRGAVAPKIGPFNACHKWSPKQRYPKSKHLQITNNTSSQSRLTVQSEHHKFWCKRMNKTGLSQDLHCSGNSINRT